MINRRNFVASAAAIALATPALSNSYRLPWKYRTVEVDVNPDLPAGQIHVIKDKFHLYWTLERFLFILNR